MNTPRQCIDELLGLETIKVWSLIVTLFGDLGREAPVELSGKDIRHLLGYIGIKPEAIRVALHRLKKDGWIITEKNGRQTLYRLSRNGILQTKSAYDEVYRDTMKYPAGWVLQLQPEEVSETQPESLPVFRNVVWVPRKQDQTKSQAQAIELTFDLANVPDWFVQRIIPRSIEDLAEKYRQTIGCLREVIESCNDLDRAALRLLALHHWRKMALRDNTWLHIWLFEDGAFAQSHRLISTLLKEHEPLPLRAV